MYSQSFPHQKCSVQGPATNNSTSDTVSILQRRFTCLSIYPPYAEELDREAMKTFCTQLLLNVLNGLAIGHMPIWNPKLIMIGRSVRE